MIEFIDILLSTFNGEKYLTEQLESIFKQDYKNWRLVIRDDGSTDDTLTIINRYKAKYPDKITFLDMDRINMGPAKSYLLLMQKSTAPYIAFCDQDDIWELTKLSSQLTIFKKAEQLNFHGCPLLLHSDLKVVDEKLHVITNSFWSFQHLDPNKMAVPERLLLQNCVTGNTILINRELLNIANRVKFHDDIIMHDWWLAIIASIKGKIISMNEITVLYRQHESNEIGAKKWGLHLFKSLNWNIIEQLRSRIFATKNQAAELLKSNILTDEERIIVTNYISLFKLGWIKKRIQLVRNGFLKYGILRNLILIIVI